MRRLAASLATAPLVGAAFLFSPTARAQQTAPPPLPPPQTQPQYQPQPAQCPPGQILVYPPGQPPMCQYTQPQQQYPQNYQPQQYPAQQPQYVPPPEEPRPAPPPVVYTEPEEPTHAPRFALWTGLGVGVLGFGNGFFINQNKESETTGAIAGTGAGVTLDVGARLGKRYIPYLFWEHGFLKQGRRFEGSDAKSSSDYYGLGFRYIALDVDSVGFLTDLSVGFRSISVTSGDQTFKMSTFEYFHLGLGAEIRLSTLIAISPLVTLSGGVMSEVEGNVLYSKLGSQDGAPGPRYCAATSGSAPCPTATGTGQQQNGQILDREGYLVLGIGVGGHFDVFGK